MSGPTPPIQPLGSAQIPALLDTWATHRGRATPRDSARAAWGRPLVERRALLEGVLRGSLHGAGERSRALVAGRVGTVTAYLIAHEVRLPRGSGYRAYAPDHFLSIGGDDWGVADPRAADLLADLYAEIAAWGLARGADAQLLAIPDGDDCAEFWLDLGFARQDRYAFLPRGAERPAPRGLTVRRAGPADLERAVHFTLAEAHHHHRAPIYAFAPPDLDATRRRDMAENLDNPATIVLLAEADGVALGGLSAFPLAGLGGWMPSATPTPCLYIDSAFVEPTARGRGVLRALVAALADLAEQRGACGLFVTYLPANRGAARAWTALGFQALLTVHQRRLDPRAARQHRTPGI